MNNQDLIDALKQAHEDILHGIDLANAVASAAADYNLHPKLLERKFTEKYGSASDVLAAAASRKAVAESLTVMAVAKAKAERQKPTYARLDHADAAGDLFEMNGEKFAFVALSSDIYPITAVKVATGEVRNWRGKTVTAAVNKLLGL